MATQFHTKPIKAKVIKAVALPIKLMRDDLTIEFTHDLVTSDRVQYDTFAQTSRRTVIGFTAEDIGCIVVRDVDHVQDIAPPTDLNMSIDMAITESYVRISHLPYVHVTHGKSPFKGQ
jgi:hypothetical protein